MLAAPNPAGGMMLSAPPVYRPSSQVGQRTPVSAGGSAPPVYRPQQQPRAAVPKGLQTAMAIQQKRVAQPSAPTGVIQRIRDTGGAGAEAHIAFGNFVKSEPAVDPASFTGVPIIIELLEKSAGSALLKVQQLLATGRHLTNPVAFVFGINLNLNTDRKVKLDAIAKFERGEVNGALEFLTGECVKVTKFMEANGLFGGCFPLAFAPTSIIEGGYTFPFLECRSILTLHPGVIEVHKEMASLGGRTGFLPVVRGMDGDVARDPLLNLEASHELAVGHLEKEGLLTQALQEVSYGSVSMISGGYDWDTNGINAGKLVSLGILNESQPAAELVNFLQGILAIVNIKEHDVRAALINKNAKGVYYPEPNVYMGLNLRVEGAKAQLEEARSLKGGTQQKESTHYIKSKLASTGVYAQELTTRKPLKDYFDNFLKYFSAVFFGTTKPTPLDIAKIVADIRQSHLDFEKVKKNLVWHGVSDPTFLEKAEKIVQRHLNACVAFIMSTIRGGPVFRQPSPKLEHRDSPAETAAMMGL
jgi:hypothetical protein